MWLLHLRWSPDIFSGGLVIYETSIMLDFTVKQSVHAISRVLAQIEIGPVGEFQRRILAFGLLFCLFLFLFFLFLFDFEGPRVDLESFLEACAEPRVSLGVRQRFAPLFGRKLGFELQWHRS